MNPLLRKACALPALALAAALSIHQPVAAAPFASYPPAPPPDGSALSLIWQGGPTVATAGNQWMRSNLGAAQTRTLESFATALGTTLGSSDDAAVFTAADAAIIAAAGSGGLIVTLPNNRVELTSVGLILDTNGGWVCQATYSCVVRMVRPATSAAVTYAAQVNPADLYATGVVLDGITFDGQWAYGRAPYAASPETDPWLDAQMGVNLTVQFNGVNDAAFVAGSSIGAQEPHMRVRNLRIGRFGGTCFAIKGAGANMVEGVVSENCGGAGFDIDTYDSHFADLDFGAVGRQPFLCHDNCASDIFTNLKGWYGGFRQIAGATAGWDEEGGSSNIVMGLYIQDEAGDCIKRDNADLGVIHAACQWQGAINALPGQVCALRTLAGIDSQIDLVVSLLNHSGQTYPTVNKLVCDGRSIRNSGYTGYSTKNDIHIVTEGFPQDYNLVSPTWLLGPLDTTNALWINGQMRQPAQWAPDPATGQNNFGADMCGTIAGMVAFGSQSPYPGGVSIVSPCGGAITLQNETTTGAYADGLLSSTANYNNGEAVTVGATTYIFKTTLTGAPDEVHIGATQAASNANLADAINAAAPAVFAGAVSGTTLMVQQVYAGVLHVGDTVTSADPLVTGWTTATISSEGTGTGGIGSYVLSASEPTVTYSNAFNAAAGVIGTDYGWGTVPSFQVAATGAAGGVAVKALAFGVAGNAIPTMTTAANAAWGAATLAGGAADTQTYASVLNLTGGQVKLPSLIAAPTYANDAAACPAVGNGGVYRDGSGGGGALRIAAC